MTTTIMQSLTLPVATFEVSEKFAVLEFLTCQMTGWAAGHQPAFHYSHEKKKHVQVKLNCIQRNKKYSFSNHERKRERFVCQRCTSYQSFSYMLFHAQSTMKLYQGAVLLIGCGLWKWNASMPVCLQKMRLPAFFNNSCSFFFFFSPLLAL